MKKYCVIGAGILGASTAYHLAKAGAEVVIIDRKDKGQATDAAAGIVCPWLSQRRNKAWYRLAKAGAKYYPSLIAELENFGLSDTGYAQVGAICLHHDHEKLLKMKERALKRRVDAPEIGNIRLLSTDEAKALFPPLADGYEAVHVSGAARVDGRALRDSLLQAAKKLGAELITGDARIVSFKNKAAAVQAGEELIDCQKIIITAGAWASELLEPLGIRFRVSAQKAQIIHLRLPKAETGEWPVVMPPSDQYILAFHDRIIAGATHENGVGFDVRITAGGLQELLNKALQTAPGLHDSTFLEARVGFRPHTPGFLPVIGSLPVAEDILIANGLGASGLTMGPYIGGQLAKLAMGQELNLPLSDYEVAGAIESFHS
ncbi:NAD(P)/FAD-dependent oxidoreductase [Bacillus xiapuensis]|uniref:NAD(P)/FAD-dependent oxidoreductase n=1 Tax=Bacillus xiapuensis TaxID=2014075 RepID=UPI000C24EC76|nr:FAD-dependent oxidoreductase [Bacillus xiapuensis]